MARHQLGHGIVGQNVGVAVLVGEARFRRHGDLRQHVGRDDVVDVLHAADHRQRIEPNTEVVLTGRQLDARLHHQLVVAGDVQRQELHLGLAPRPQHLEPRHRQMADVDQHHLAELLAQPLDRYVGQQARPDDDGLAVAGNRRADGADGDARPLLVLGPLGAAAATTCPKTDGLAARLVRHARRHQERQGVERDFRNHAMRFPRRWSPLPERPVADP